LALTSAGIEMCKSLQHRVAADAQVAKILKKRENGDVEARRGESRPVLPCAQAFTRLPYPLRSFGQVPPFDPQ
jgi:hypothetical protein